MLRLLAVLSVEGAGDAIFSRRKVETIREFLEESAWVAGGCLQVANGEGSRPEDVRSLAASDGNEAARFVSLCCDFSQQDNAVLWVNARSGKATEVRA